MLNDMFGSDSSLASVALDLTAEARAGRLEPVRCRGDEIARVIDILLRHSKNNPALVGPAGVGKTAIAEGLAQRVAAGAVPLALRKAKILALDHVALLAGTMYRGQYEERIRSIVEHATKDPDIILFIDELHNLIGQGTALGVAMDAANMLKPALVRGDFRVIGATTSDEYDRWIRNDPALERRFQRLLLSELTAEQTLEVLEARRDRLERHHNVAISDDAMLAAVRLTDLFITDRARPDRAIDALDEACAHAQARAHYPPPLEAIMAERRDLARRLGQGAPRGAEPTRRDDEEEREGVAVAEDDDPVERWARSGFAALERFGQEIEAAFSGREGAAGAGRAGADRAAATEAAAAASAEPREAPREAPREPARPRPRPTASRLAELDAELRRRFIEEGLVVRGHDVARVVSVATGRRVEWKA